VIVPAFAEQSARGMLRNFGPDAVARAEALAERYSQQNYPAAAELWAAIARDIRRLAESLS